MFGSFALKIRRGETPFYRGLRTFAKGVLSSTLPLPRALNPVLRVLFNAHQGFFHVLRFVRNYCYTEPLFRGRCETAGKGLRLTRMPFVIGHARIYIGNNVNFFGSVDVFSGAIFAEPKLIIKDRVDIGHGAVFIVNKEIVIEEDVNIASPVKFMDSDAHPKDTQARIADLPPPPEEVKPIRVCRNAWIGGGSAIMKGVTIGEGAIIGVNSVVVTDIPPYTVAMGNPARVVVKMQPPQPVGPAKPVDAQATNVS